MSISIVIADDHPVVRVGIEGLLIHYPEFEIIGEATTGDEALNLCLEKQPDVLVLDINMPGLKAVQVVSQIRQCQLPTRILIMTSHGDAGIVYAMLQAGAIGYLLKDDGPTAIVEAIRKVASGETWFSKNLESIVESLKDENGTNINITEREKEILLLVSEGLTNKEIAQQLEITERTVESHLTQIFRKSGISSRVELALWAKERSICGF